MLLHKRSALWTVEVATFIQLGIQTILKKMNPSDNDSNSDNNMITSNRPFGGGTTRLVDVIESFSMLES